MICSHERRTRALRPHPLTTMQEQHDRSTPRWVGTVVLVLAVMGVALSGQYGPLARIVGIALMGPLIVAGLQLFYGVPLRGRGVGSRVFWRVWAIACGVLLALWLLIEARSGQAP